MVALGAALSVLLAALGAGLMLRAVGDGLNGNATAAPDRVPFAGGHPPSTHAWSRFHVRYYTMALLFLVFDMEMVFMYPWAVVFVREGIVALVEMHMYITILVLGVLYAWRERALEWA